MQARMDAARMLPTPRQVPSTHTSRTVAFFNHTLTPVPSGLWAVLPSHLQCVTRAILCGSFFSDFLLRDGGCHWCP